MSRDGGRSRDEDAVEIALQNKNIGIVEMLLREYTLKNAVNKTNNED